MHFWRPLSFTCVSSLVLACSANSKPNDAASTHDDAHETPGDGGSEGSQDGGSAGGGKDSSVPGNTGNYVVGTQRIEIVQGDDRILPVQLWYPAAASARAEAEKGRALVDFEPAGEKRDALEKLVAAAPDKCTNKTMHAADAPEVFLSSSKWPLIVFSHCMDCVRFGMFTVAERLANLGFVVVAPDHVGGTVYEGKAVLDSDFLKVREADIVAVLDTMLSDDSEVVPAGLRGRLDPEHVGALGHSYGSVTTGLVLQNDARVKAGVLIAAPPDSPLLSGASIAQIKKPALYFEAMEDHSIQLIGNSFLEMNYQSHPNPAWLVKLADAGHWSFTDICALTSTFKPGCGTDTRQNPAQGGMFTYLDNDVARDITANYVTAFFARELLGDAERGAYLDQATPADVVMLEYHD